jgi:hypothetical protein
VCRACSDPNLVSNFLDGQTLVIFEAVKLLFDFRSTRCIITESLLNLLDCFRFGISKLLAKLDAASRIQSYWAKCNATSTY